MEMVWICIVAITYVMLLCAFLVYRKIKSIDEYYDREFERLGVRIGRLDDHLYELKQKIDNAPTVETKPLTCTEWTPITGRNPGQDVDKRFKRVWDAIDAMKEDVDTDWSELHDDVERHEELFNSIFEKYKRDYGIELDELRADVERHEELINSVSMITDRFHDRLNCLNDRLNYLEKRVLRPEKEGAECAPE